MFFGQVDKDPVTKLFTRNFDLIDTVFRRQRRTGWTDMFLCFYLLVLIFVIQLIFGLTYLAHFACDHLTYLFVIAVQYFEIK